MKPGKDTRTNRLTPAGNHGFTLIELMITVVIIGLLASIALPNFFRMRYNAQEAAVKRNAHVVQLAAEDFAVQNFGVYPFDTGTPLPSGDTLVDLLPSGILLPNPFSQALDSPVNGIAAVPGTIGYQFLDTNADGSPDGYSITGYGADALILTYTAGI